MAVVELKKSGALTRRQHEGMERSHVKKSNRKSFQKYSTHLKPKSAKGASAVKVGRKRYEKPRVWYVSNKKSGADRKIRVTASTPRKAAMLALKLNGWGTGRAYVADGRGLGAIVSYKKGRSAKTGRTTYLSAKSGKPYVPKYSDDSLSSSEGVEKDSYDYHTTHSRRTYVKSGKHKGRSKSKAKTATTGERHITEKTVETAVKNAAKEASEEASQGNKRVASSAAKEAVKEVLTANPTKASSKTAAKSVASEAKKHAQASAKSSGADAATAKAAGEAAQHAVQKAVTPRQTTTSSSKASEEERKDFVAMLEDLNDAYEKYVDYANNHVDVDYDAFDEEYGGFIKSSKSVFSALRKKNWRDTIAQQKSKLDSMLRHIEGTESLFGENHGNQRMYQMEHKLDRLIRRIGLVHKAMV